MSYEKNNRSWTFYGILKNIFILVLILQFIPSIISNFNEHYEDTMNPKQAVGFLKLEGPIFGSAFYTKKIEQFRKKPEIKALLIKINCPGGLPGSAQMIFNELKKFKKEKRIVAIVENVCASGAYYIASVADTIIASPSSLIGSIGAIAQIPNVKGLLDRWDIKVNHIASGKYKAVGSPVKEISAEELQYLKEISDDTYVQFANDVAECRKLKKKDMTKWADGRIFTGNMALNLGLIDKMGTFSDSIDEIKKLAGISDEVKLVTLKKAVSPLKRLLSGDDEDDEYGSSELSTRLSNFITQTITACYKSITSIHSPQLKLSLEKNGSVKNLLLI
jgi:protease IV